MSFHKTFSNCELNKQTFNNFNNYLLHGIDLRCIVNRFFLIVDDIHTFIPYQLYMVSIKDRKKTLLYNQIWFPALYSGYREITFLVVLLVSYAHNLHKWRYFIVSVQCLQAALTQDTYSWE